jgi:hypothetical protein
LEAFCIWHWVNILGWLAKVTFVILKLSSLHGIECGADMEVIPRKVCLCHTDDISAEEREAQKLISMVFACC